MGGIAAGIQPPEEERNGMVKHVVARPVNIPLEVWKLTQGGFPDGETSLSPAKRQKRPKRMGN